MTTKGGWTEIRPGLWTRPVSLEIMARMPVIEPKKSARQKISEFIHNLRRTQQNHS